MIPKKIHYCWFGGNPLDDLALKCIASWKKYFPDYEIIQWNESNFDVSQIQFMKDAYDAKKWAFVSDVARLLVVYQNGGLYFDTDVEVISDYNDILKDAPNGFLAFETTNYVTTGLGFGAIQNHPLLKELLDVYRAIDFNQYIDKLADIACPILTTELLQTHGYVVQNTLQECCNLKIYPSEYFSPIDYMTGRLSKTSKTHSIHWYSGSWNSAEERKNRAVSQRMRRLFGVKLGNVLFDAVSCVKREGFWNYIKRHL